jgi:hypothetical protein
MEESELLHSTESQEIGLEDHVKIQTGNDKDDMDSNYQTS